MLAILAALASSGVQAVGWEGVTVLLTGDEFGCVILDRRSNAFAYTEVFYGISVIALTLIHL
jgi:hypothetical protein